MRGLLFPLVVLPIVTGSFGCAQQSNETVQRTNLASAQAVAKTCGYGANVVKLSSGDRYHPPEIEIVGLFFDQKTNQKDTRLICFETRMRQRGIGFIDRTNHGYNPYQLIPPPTKSEAT